MSVYRIRFSLIFQLSYPITPFRAPGEVFLVSRKIMLASFPSSLYYITCVWRMPYASIQDRDVVQVVERLTGGQEVAGSSPVIPTTKRICAVRLHISSLFLCCAEDCLSPAFISAPFKCSTPESSPPSPMPQDSVSRCHPVFGAAEVFASFRMPSLPYGRRRSALHYTV